MASLPADNLKQSAAYDHQVSKSDDGSDSSILTSTLVEGTANGDLTLNGDGSFEFVPDPDFFGSDRFTYTATDGTDVSNVAEAESVVLAGAR